MYRIRLQEIYDGRDISRCIHNTWARCGWQIQALQLIPDTIVSTPSRWQLISGRHNCCLGGLEARPVCRGACKWTEPSCCWRGWCQ